MAQPSDRSHYQRIWDLIDRTSADLPHDGRAREFTFPGAHLKHGIISAVFIFCVLLALSFVGDCVAIRYRVAVSRQPFGTVQVDRIYAITQKGGKTEFSYAGTEHETCVNSLFPHFGYTPCWYLKRHNEKRIDL